MMFCIWDSLANPFGSRNFPLQYSLNAVSACSRVLVKGIIRLGLNSPESRPVSMTGVWQKCQRVEAVRLSQMTPAPQFGQV